MKKLIPFILFLFLMASCDFSETREIIYNINEPVFMPKDEFRRSINVSQQAREINSYGKICYYKAFLYIAEPGKGIHIVNNTDPAAPVITGYIELIGNNDITIKNNILYADAISDLVWFDISDPAQPELKGRLEDAFPQGSVYPNNDYSCDWQLVESGTSADKILIAWEVKERVETIEINTGGDDYSVNLPVNDGGSSSGVNGSMSRFGLYDNYLYTVINNTMDIFDLSASVPEKVNESIYIGWEVETIFSYKENMFMGTPRGMIIYSVADPLNPAYCSSISHVFACDPVVVEDDIAYVTIHSGNNCGQNSNELIVIDVSDVYNPQAIVSYAMKQPKGLGIDKGTLFICDDGLKVFNSNDPYAIMANQLAHYKGMSGYDLIPFNNVLMMIADDGLYQYDYSDLNNIRELSVLPFNKSVSL